MNAPPVPEHDAQTTPRARATPRTRRTLTRRELALLACVALGLSAAAALSHWLMPRHLAAQAQARTDELYVTPAAARRMSLGFNGLAADWYWLRSLQYVGRKVGAYEGRVQLDDLSPVGLDLLAPLLNTAVALDPQFLSVYEYGAIVLPAIDVDAAVRLVERGTSANPRAWRLYHHLGYIYWQQGRFGEAADAYRRGAQIQDAPEWMQAMAAQLAAQGGSRATAYEIYRRMYEQADDERLRALAFKRLLQLRSWDERDALRRVLAVFRERAGRCPAAWREVAPVLRAARLPLDPTAAPLDPSGAPYALAGDGCDVELGAQSEILRK
jgi:tetratricopeptide (TPR) repeat protein